MPRDLPLGNGSLLVTFDQTYQIRALSVSPLTWSHAAFVTTLHAYLGAQARLKGHGPFKTEIDASKRLDVDLL